MKYYHGESGYFDLLKDTLNQGTHQIDRTSVGSNFKVFAPVLSFDLSKSFPTSTARLLSARLGFEEFWAFLNCRLDIHNYLEPKKVNFWKGNTTREFLDGRGLHQLPVGHIGKGYSFQYRNFGGHYTQESIQRGTYEADMKGVDQIIKTIEGLKSEPFDRRHLVSIWNPNQVDEMTLPPCFWAHNFVCQMDEDQNVVLNLAVIARSSDMLFGLPSNWQQFALYLSAVAKLLNYKVGSLSLFLADAHIYDNQVEYTKELLTREIYDLDVKIEFKKELNTIEDFLSLKWEDIDLVGHKYNTKEFVTPHPEMAV